MKVLNILAAVASMAISTVATSAYATSEAKASADNLYASTTGEVVLTFLSKSADYATDLFLTGSATSILNNQTAVAGTQYSLGTFEQGQLISFDMLVNDTGFRFHSGSAANNIDQFIHVTYEESARRVIVGFEDLYGGGDQDYNDLVFSLTNASVGNLVSSVPEPGNYAMLLAGLGLVGVAARRRTQG
ncbi:MAG TPA: PEP-CTERM sorting domain-containing protein [Methylophilaceae bacterium]|nr:PEP-CTERM sorting domain-containing protein [Methylophilaceae bacterium]